MFPYPSSQAPPDLSGPLMAGPGPGAGPAPMGQESPEGMSPAEHLRLAIEHAQAALVGEPDDTDSQTLSRVIQGLYSILASRQKETQQVLGNAANQRVISRGQAA